MSEASDGRDLHALGLTMAQLDGRVQGLVERLSADSSTAKASTLDHESRLRLLEARPRSITWPEYLFTTSGLLGLAIALNTLLDLSEIIP